MDTQELTLSNGVPSFCSVGENLKEASYLLSLVGVLGGDRKRSNMTPTIFYALAMCQAPYNHYLN